MTDTIFFDVGNTLRIVIPDKEFSDAAEAELMRLVGATEPKEVFFEKLEAILAFYNDSMMNNFPY